MEPHEISAESNQQQQQIQHGTETLPNATGVLVMGIISIATCWCYGIPGLVLGIISLVMGSKSLKLYKANPGLYSLTSYKNLKAGYVCAIVGLCLSALYFVVIIIYFLIVGFAVSMIPFSNM